MPCRPVGSAEALPGSGSGQPALKVEQLWHLVEFLLLSGLAEGQLGRPGSKGEEGELLSQVFDAAADDVIKPCFVAGDEAK